MKTKHCETDDRRMYSAIQACLRPVLEPSGHPVDQRRCLEALRERCDEVLLPFREYLESDLAEFDYRYNDYISFDAGQWSAEIVLLLHKGLSFQDRDADLLRQQARPVWILRIWLSLVYPVFLMTIERMELSKTRPDWVDCFS